MNWIIFYFILNSFLFSKEIQTMNWKNKTITKEVIEENSIKTTHFYFRDNKNKIVFKDSFEFGNYEIAGLYKTNEEEFFHIAGFTGGESGCCTFNRFYYILDKKIQYVDMEQLAYGPFQIVDLDGDKIEEIMIFNDLFYPFYISHSELGFNTEKSECFVHLEGTLSGFIEPILPKYIQLVRYKKSFRKVDISFEKKYISAISVYLKKAEAYILKNKNTYMGESIKGILQYYYYMTKLGQEKQALEVIKKSKIKLLFKNKKLCKPDIYLVDLIESNRDKILNNQNKIN
jgi:hypothetical protein